MDTPCKRCIFAVYEGKTQTACSLDRLKLYDNVLEAYDEEKEFFVIKGKVCPLGRTDEWGPYQRNESNLAGIARKEARIKYAAIIFIGKESTTEQIHNTYDALISQSVPPTQLIMLQEYGGKFTPVQLRKICMDCKCKWTVECVIVQMEKLQCISLAMNKIIKKCRYYAVFDAGMTPHSEVFANLDKLLIDKAQPIIAVLPNDNNGLIMLKTLTYSHIGIDENDKDNTECQKFVIKMNQL